MLLALVSVSGYAAKHPALHTNPPPTENDPAPKVSRARVEKSRASGLLPSSRQEVYSLKSN